MTVCGKICTTLLILLAAAGMIYGMIRMGKEEKRRGRPVPGVPGAGLPTVTGEPVIFRRAETRVLTCKSSMDIGPGRLEERGFDSRSKGQREAAALYFKKELAYRLADQLIEAGGIEYEIGGRYGQDGSTIRATVKVELPGRSGT